VKVGTNAVGQTILYVTLAGAGNGQFVLTNKTELHAAGGAGITISDLAPGDRLRAQGTPDPQNAGVYDVSLVRDLDVSYLPTSGFVKSVDVANNQITVTAADGSKDVTVPVGANTKILGQDGNQISLSDLQPTAGVTITGLHNSRTSAYVRVTKVQETTPPVPLTVTVTQPGVHPGATETLTIQTAPNATLNVSVQFPSGETVTLPATADANGNAAVAIKVPVDAYRTGSTVVTAAVATTVQNLTRSVDVTFSLSLPRLAVFLAHSRIHTGERETITVLSTPHAHIKLSIAFPNGTVWNRSRTTNADGMLTYSFTVPKHHMRRSNHTVVVWAYRLSGSKASSHKQFHVLTG
jgi:hypothetical protein